MHILATATGIGGEAQLDVAGVEGAPDHDGRVRAADIIWDHLNFFLFFFWYYFMVITSLPLCIR